MPEILSYICDMDITLLGTRALISRRDLGLRQEEVAEQIGVSRTYISKIEHGDAPGVSLDVIGKLAAALGVSPAYLMGLTDNPLEGINTISDERGAYDAISPEEEELLDLVQQMTPEQRKQMLWGARLILGNPPRIIE